MTATPTPTLRDLTPWEVDRAEFLRALIPSSPEAHRQNPELAREHEREIAADVERAIATWRTLPAPGPCPWYCALPAGHGYIEDDPRAPADTSRFHGRLFHANHGAFGFYVSQLEVAQPDGTITLHAPEMLLPDNGNVTLTDAGEVQEVEEAASAAAALFKRITTS